MREPGSHADELDADLKAELTSRGASDERFYQMRSGGLDPKEWGPAITSVDMTPRPRYRESQEAFEARMVALGADLAALRQDARQRNRTHALKGPVMVGEVKQWFTQCACGWCGLQVTDPELARREYDSHACRIDGVGQAATDRAIAETDRRTLAKRSAPAAVQPTEELRAAVAAVVSPVDEELEQALSGLNSADATEQRMALLELK